MSEETEELNPVELVVNGANPEDREELVEVINHEVDRFNSFLLTQAQTHDLTRAEAAILRTYMIYKAQKAF